MICPACSKDVAPGDSVEDRRGRAWHRDCALEVLAGAAVEKVEPVEPVVVEAVEPAPPPGPVLKWKCRGCGYAAADQFYIGRCPGCGRFYNRELDKKAEMAAHRSITDIASGADPPTISTGIDALDDVLSGNLATGKRGGMVLGSLVALLGAPSGGKSTITIMVAGNVATPKCRVMLVSTEETEKDRARAAQRIGVLNPHVLLYGVDTLGCDVDDILEMADKQKPKILIVDSLTTCFTKTSAAEVGSTAQIVACLRALYYYTKRHNICTIATSQINSAGEAKGGTGVEHSCDTLLSIFPSLPSWEWCDPAESNLRALHVGKNRNGNGAKKYLFEIGEKGLVPVKVEDRSPRRRR